MARIATVGVRRDQLQVFEETMYFQCVRSTLIDVPDVQHKLMPIQDRYANTVGNTTGREHVSPPVMAGGTRQRLFCQKLSRQSPIGGSLTPVAACL